VMCVFMDEAWMLEAREIPGKLEEQKRAMREAATSGRSLEFAPGRIETLAFIGESDIGVLVARREITRLVGAKPQLGPLVYIEPDGGEEGRLVGMLPARRRRARQ
jgi:hypothetical protein